MIDASAFAELKNLLGGEQVLTEPAELLVYEADAALDRALPQAVIFVRSRADVQHAAGWAARHKIALVARGAGTGLSGGAVAEHGGAIVEFSQMQRILELDPAGRSAAVEPGVVNLTLDEAARRAGMYYPPDPASGRSATLGGNVAENAGGPHCFKYGVTTNYLTGLEFVLPGGQVLTCGGPAYDYPEFDFTGALAGSEGTLALATKILVRLLRQPPAIKAMMAAFDSVETAGAAVSALISSGLAPATLEMMDQKIARIVEDFAHPGIPTGAGALLIVDVDGYPEALDPQIEELSAILLAHGGYDLRVAHSAEAREQIWYARKSAAGAMARLAPAYLLLDGTVPRSALAQALEQTNRICERRGLQVGYVFHAGDGNLHPFILTDPRDPAHLARARQAGGEFMQAVVDLGGSITGEHGVGIEKRRYMALMYTPGELAIMGALKQVFDPHGLLNPGKIFPAAAEALAQAGDPSATASPPEGYAAQRVGPPVGAARPEEQAAQQDGLSAGRSAPPGAPGGPPAAPTAAAAALPFYAPQTIAQAAEWLAACSRGGQAVSLRGAGRAAAGCVLSTARLSGIRAYAPDDLYIRVGAGTPLSELHAFLEKEGRQAAVYSPWPQATLGGALASNLNAPARLRYGGLRDQALEMSIVLGDGRTLRAGRPVVKNVAGYDLPKLLVGSFGALGLIGEATLKISARPRLRQSLLIPVDSVTQGAALAQAAVGLAFVSSGVVLARNPGDLAGLGSPYVLVDSLAGQPEDVQQEAALVQAKLAALGVNGAQLVEGELANELWAAFLNRPAGDALLVRAAFPPGRLEQGLVGLAALLEAGDFLVDAGSGFIYAAARPATPQQAQEFVALLRAPALASAGYAVVIDCPPQFAGQVERWGYRPQTLELMRRLKALWDPAGILNPGEFI